MLSSTDHKKIQQIFLELQLLKHRKLYIFELSLKTTYILHCYRDEFFYKSFNAQRY